MRNYWSKLEESPASSVVIKALVLSAKEALDKKIGKWNKKLIYSAAYVDPVERIHFDGLRESAGVSLNEVGLILIHLLILHLGRNLYPPNE